MPTPTVHQHLLQAISSALQALAAVPASRVYLERPTPVLADECPAINLLPDGARFSRFGGNSDFGAGTLRAEVGVRLRVYTRGSPHTALADPVIGQANAALMADPSLGGLCLQLALLESAPQQAAADGTAGTWELGYQAVVLVDEATLAILAN